MHRLALMIPCFVFGRIIIWAGCLPTTSSGLSCSVNMCLVIERCSWVCAPKLHTAVHKVGLVLMLVTAQLFTNAHTSGRSHSPSVGISMLPTGRDGIRSTHSSSPNNQSVTNDNKIIDHHHRCCHPPGVTPHCWLTKTVLTKLCVCVCAQPPLFGGSTVKRVIPNTSFPPYDPPPIPWQLTCSDRE